MDNICINTATQHQNPATMQYGYLVNPLALEYFQSPQSLALYLPHGFLLGQSSLRNNTLFLITPRFSRAKNPAIIKPRLCVCFVLWKDFEHVRSFIGREEPRQNWRVSG
jgi:hypothetical protein